MKPNERLEALWNEQINLEYHSAFIYLQMAAWCDDNSYPGFAQWFRIQYQEEANHAAKIFNHMLERGMKVKLRPIAGVTTEYESILDIWQQSVGHEKVITEKIRRIYIAVREENDFDSEALVQWFTDEQVEEMDKFTEWEARIARNTCPTGIERLDREAGRRALESQWLTEELPRNCYQ